MCFKHRGDVGIHGFYVSVSFVMIGFHVSMNVFDGVVMARYCYIRFDRRDRRDNINCFNGGC